MRRQPAIILLVTVLSVICLIFLINYLTNTSSVYKDVKDPQTQVNQQPAVKVISATPTMPVFNSQTNLTNELDSSTPESFSADYKNLREEVLKRF